MVVFIVHFPQLSSKAAIFLTFNNVNFFKIIFSRFSKFNILQVQYVFLT